MGEIDLAVGWSYSHLSKLEYTVPDWFERAIADGVKVSRVGRCIALVSEWNFPNQRERWRMRSIEGGGKNHEALLKASYKQYTTNLLRSLSTDHYLAILFRSGVMVGWDKELLNYFIDETVKVITTAALRGNETYFINPGLEPSFASFFHAAGYKQLYKRFANALEALRSQGKVMLLQGDSCEGMKWEDSMRYLPEPSDYDWYTVGIFDCTQGSKNYMRKVLNWAKAEGKPVYLGEICGRHITHEGGWTDAFLSFLDDLIDSGQIKGVHLILQDWRAWTPGVENRLQSWGDCSLSGPTGENLLRWMERNGWA